MRRFNVYIVIFIILLSVMLATFLIWKKGNDIGFVELTTGGKGYNPYSHWVYSLHDGIAADGLRFSKAAVEYNPDLRNGINKLEEIPVSDDIKITKMYLDGSYKRETLSYRIYDSDFEIIQDANDIAQIGENKGIYYLVATTHWGTEEDHDGYEYIFKVKVK